MTSRPEQRCSPSLRGGCDIVKDDELLGNTGFSASVKRVAANIPTADLDFEETGQTGLKCVNVTDRPDRMLEAARRAVELGAHMIMINAVQAAAADPAISVPILAHYAGASSMTEGSAAVIFSPLLLGKLMRLCGADASSFNSPCSVCPLLREKFAETARSLALKLGDVRPSMPAPGGRIQPATAERIVEELGSDAMLAVGGAILGPHGRGVRRGAVAAAGNRCRGGRHPAVRLRRVARRIEDLYRPLGRLRRRARAR